jgi:hypothetical protein
MSAIPRKGDRAFSGPTDIRMGVTFLHLMGINRSYIRGFQNAAETLVKTVKNSEAIHFTYGMVLPACFLYRHYLELEMKYILTQGDKLGIMAVSADDLEDHPLYPLWRACPEFCVSRFLVV